MAGGHWRISASPGLGNDDTTNHDDRHVEERQRRFLTTQLHGAGGGTLRGDKRSLIAIADDEAVACTALLLIILRVPNRWLGAQGYVVGLDAVMMLNEVNNESLPRDISAG